MMWVKKTLYKKMGKEHMERRLDSKRSDRRFCSMPLICALFRWYNEHETGATLGTENNQEKRQCYIRA